MRLDKLLSEMGVSSRREVKELTRAGRVTVNGIPASAPDMKVSEADEVCLDGKPVGKPGPVVYMLNKPAGYLCAVRDERHPVVMELVPDQRRGLAPVGRLDLDSEGLLLITDDGLLAHRLLAPKNRVPKKYFVITDRDIPPEAAEILSKPVVFKDFTSLPGKYEQLSDRTAFLTVFEGKFHEVKRLFHAAGCEVTRLVRVEFGPLSLKDLPQGSARLLTETEREALYSCAVNIADPADEEQY